MRRVSLLFVALLLLSCGPPPASNHPIKGVEADGTPKWVHRGSGAFDADSGGKALFGVGIADGIRNESLSRQTADNRARREVAAMFDLYIAAMMKDYQRSTTAGDFQNSSEEQDVVSAQKTITEATVPGIEIRDHWMNPHTGALYALAVLDMTGLMKAIDQAKELNSQVRDFVRRNAQKAFRDLDAELRKRSDRGR